MKRVLLLFISGWILVSGCLRDKREVLFPMVYPNFDFELPSGFYLPDILCIPGQRL